MAESPTALVTQAINMRGTRRRYSKLRGVALWAGLLLGGGLSPLAYAQGGEIVVGAAISLKEAFNELGGVYQQRTGTKVTFSFGASGELEKQIEAGAPLDVFASAAEKEMDELAGKNLIDEATRADFVRNSLVLVVPRDSMLELHSLSDLDKPGVSKIAIGDPKTVPAGQYAQQLLRNARLWSKVESRLILAENVRQVLDYVARGEVDAGIVYATDVSIAHGKVSVATRAPDGKYGPILYPLAVIRSSANAQAAKRFVYLVLSPEGVAILERHGFEPAK
jgi:molybdate transport system substrate-binding protein